MASIISWQFIGSLASPRTRAAASRALTFFSLGLALFCALGSAFSVFVFLVLVAATMMFSLWVVGIQPGDHRQADAHEGRTAAAMQAIFCRISRLSKMGLF